MSLLKVTPAIFEALKTQRIPTMHAILLQQASVRFTEKQIDEFIAAIERKELSTRELERRIKRVDNKDLPARKPELFKQTTNGFKLSGISYRGNMGKEQKKQVVAALKKALALLTGKEGSDE